MCRRSSRSAYRVAPTATVYGTAARGFKAGGFNAASPAGAEAYGQEHSWNYEGGVKTSALADRLSASVAAFYIDWQRPAGERPEPARAGAVLHRATPPARRSTGVEVEVHARPEPGLGSVRRRRLHARALRRRQHVERRRRERQPAWRTRPATRPTSASSTRGRCAARSSLIARAEASATATTSTTIANTAGTGRVYAREPARRPARQAHVRRSLGPQRVRHALHPGRVPVPGPGAVRVRRRERRAADVRGAGWG